MPLTILIGGQEWERGTWRGSSEPSPRLLQDLMGIVTSPGPGLGRDPIHFLCGEFLGLELRIRNSVNWQ